MSRQLRLLIVEDSEDDTLLLVRELRKGDYDVTYERVESRDSMKAALDRQWDLVVADYMLPVFSGLAALKLLRESGIDLPFIIVSGHIGEDVAVSAMKAGAHDYILKGKLKRLVPAVERELRDAEVRRERRKAEIALREMNEHLEQRTAELQQAYDRLMEETREREQAQEQLRQAQKMEALGTLTGGIAHDFNNILAAIIGFTDVVRDHLPKGSLDARSLDRVMEAGLRGRDLIKRMLAFSRKTEQDKKPLQLYSLVKEIMKLLRASIPTTVGIKVDVKSESSLVLADPVQVEQVLMNLCANAAYAMREKGGMLDVELSDFSVGQSNGNPHAMKPGPYVRLIVCDTGEGIPENVIDRIFDPFFTTKKLGEGTGLGLSAVHGIVEQHDGYVTVTSEPGKGSTFSVYLPKIAEELSLAETVDEEAVPTGHERILFIDDEEMLVEMGQDLLEGLGYQVTATTGSLDALALFRADPSRFDLVITDQTMPNLTGVELAKAVIALKPDMPVILCTGFSHLVDADTAKASGIRAFAMKPLTKSEIARAVRSVLDE